MASLVRWTLLCLSLFSASHAISNPFVYLDMQQNNPGDAVAWQQSKYSDPAALLELNYSGRVVTGELSGTQAVDFHTLGDFFPAHTPARAWLDSYRTSIQSYHGATKRSGMKSYFFVDMIVFPKSVLDVWTNATDGSGHIVWNDATRFLLSTQIDETFAMFPDSDGFVIRTGETYVFDTPYHVGNSPTNHTNARWTEFITFLRDTVCIKHNKQLFFRSWDNWASDPRTYADITTPIPPHTNLYFSIKHSSEDFYRPASWNTQLGSGGHAQIVEVELQREYEGKGAYPNYVMDGVISGFPEMDPPIGLRNIINAPQIKGIWTWTRGGGWWGPYIHGRELWVELHARVLAQWWHARGERTEEQVFQDVCPLLVSGCNGTCCAALRNIVQQGAAAVYNGQYGARVGSWPGIWMRDDRLGGLGQVSHHFSSLGDNTTLWNETVAVRQKAMTLWESSQRIYDSTIKGNIASQQTDEWIATSLEYGTRLHEVVEAGWRTMAHGYRKQHNMSYSQSELDDAIADYDYAWEGYQAFGLANVYAPSLYHDYYLCLGNDCSGAFVVPNNPNPGMGASVGMFRS